MQPFHQELPVLTAVNAELIRDNRVAVTWEAVDQAGIVQGFTVSIAETTAAFYEKLVPGASTRSFSTDFDLLDALPATSDTDADSLWYLVRVRAYDANLFQGPPSEPDSIVIVR